MPGGCINFFSTKSGFQPKVFSKDNLLECQIARIVVLTFSDSTVVTCKISLNQSSACLKEMTNNTNKHLTFPSQKFSQHCNLLSILSLLLPFRYCCIIELIYMTIKLVIAFFFLKSAFVSLSVLWLYLTHGGNFTYNFSAVSIQRILLSLQKGPSCFLLCLRISESLVDVGVPKSVSKLLFIHYSVLVIYYSCLLYNIQLKWKRNMIMAAICSPINI